MRFTRHAIERIVARLARKNINPGIVEHVVKHPDITFYNTLKGRYIAVKYDKRLVAVYEKREDEILIITAMYISEVEELVRRRVGSGRWIPL